jgi:putative acyl-CoA dehydrogenase
VEANSFSHNTTMAFALQASLLVRHSSTTVADAFCATRLDGEWGHAFGTLPPGLDTQAIIDRARIKDAEAAKRHDGRDRD